MIIVGGVWELNSSYIGYKISRQKVEYVRFMDDWCILAKTRWQLKRAIAAMKKAISGLKLTLHPDKTEGENTGGDYG